MRPCSVLAGITQLFLWSSWKKVGTLDPTAGRRTVTSAGWPDAHCPPPHELSSAFQQTMYFRWSERLVRNLELMDFVTDLKQQSCYWLVHSYIQRFCSAVDILRKFIEISSNHSFPILSPSTAFIFLYCKDIACTKHNAMPTKINHLNMRSNQAVLTWHLTMAPFGQKKLPEQYQAKVTVLLLMPKLVCFDANQIFLH